MTDSIADVIATIMLIVVFGVVAYIAGRGDVINTVINMLQETAEDSTRVTCGRCKFNCDGICLHPKNDIKAHVPELGEYYVVARAPTVDDDHYCARGIRVERKDV